MSGKIYVFLSLFISVYCLPPPSYLKPCSVSKDFEKCVAKTSQEVISSIVNGDKKYEIPSIDPFKFQHLTLSFGQTFHMDLSDVIAVGFSKLQVKAVKYEPGTKKFTVIADVPQLTLSGHYVASGKILSLPVSGNGAFEITVFIDSATYKYELASEERNGEIYGKVINDSLDLDIPNAKLNFENAFDGDAALSAQLNTVINENWKDVFKDLEGSIQQTFSTIITFVAETYFKKIPLNQLILE